MMKVVIGIFSILISKGRYIRCKQLLMDLNLTCYFFHWIIIDSTVRNS